MVVASAAAATSATTIRFCFVYSFVRSFPEFLAGPNIFYQIIRHKLLPLISFPCLLSIQTLNIRCGTFFSSSSSRSCLRMYIEPAKSPLNGCCCFFVVVVCFVFPFTHEMLLNSQLYSRAWLLVCIALLYAYCGKSHSNGSLGWCFGWCC